MSTLINHGFIGTWHKARLPSAYQEVEYIESSGTQYIDTGFSYNQNTGEIKAKFVPTLLGNDYYVFPLGGATTGNSRSFIMYNAYQFAHIGLGSSVYNTSVSVSVNTLYEVDAKITTAGTGTCSYTMNGTTKSVSYAGYIAAGRNYYIFCSNDNGTPSNVGYYKLYYYKMYQAGTLVRDFVPCYRKSDNVIGMYDLVNNQFYTNSGSGTFTKGPDVN